MKRTLGLLWVTRSSPFNLLTAQRLRAIGQGVIITPLFDVRPLEASSIEIRPDLIAFTSVNGVRYHPYQAEWVHVPVYAVGDTTAAAARRCGYRDVRSANGNLQDLQALILRNSSTGLRLVHFSAREPAGDLAAYLRSRGFEAFRHCVYETMLRPLQQVKGVLAGKTPVHGIVVHSRKAARRAANLVAEIGWKGAVFCISEACAGEFSGISGLSVSSAVRPTERALMEMIRRAINAQAARAELRLRGVQLDVGGTTKSKPPSSANDNVDAAPTPA